MTHTLRAIGCCGTEWRIETLPFVCPTCGRVALSNSPGVATLIAGQIAALQQQLAFFQQQQVATARTIGELERKLAAWKTIERLESLPAESVPETPSTVTPSAPHAVPTLKEAVLGVLNAQRGTPFQAIVTQTGKPPDSLKATLSKLIRAQVIRREGEAGSYCYLLTTAAP